MKAMGIDLGTTTVSIVVVDCDSGDVLGSRTVSHEAFIKGHISVSKVQDAKKLVRIVKEIICELSYIYGKPDVIGLTGQMHGMLYIDVNGEAVSPLYTWQDGCGNEKMEDGRTYAEVLQEIRGASGTGFGLTTHFYLQKNELIPHNAVKMVTISDYIGMQLCGKKDAVIAKDMAASWGCFDLKKCDFFKEDLEKLGVDISFLPELMKEHFIIGKTMGDIPEGVLVVVSLGDNQASVLGSVKDLCDTVLINIGTGSQVSVGTKGYYECDGSVELRPCIGDISLLVGSGLCGGRAYAMLEKFYREIGGKEDMMYTIMERQARDFLEVYGKDAAWKVRTTFSGTRSNPTEKGSIEGISVENFHPGAMTVGMLQGILRELYEMYQQIYEKTGKKATQFVGSGNGIRKNILMQELAEEIFGMKLQIPVCKEEAAYGVALYAMTAVGIVKDISEAQNKIQYYI